MVHPSDLLPIVRLLQEARTATDPTLVVGTLQMSTLPPNTTPARSRGRTLSQSSSQHSCPYPDCRKTFDTRSDLSHHARNHISPEERPLACEPCGVSFLYQKDLNRHCKSQKHRRNPQVSNDSDAAPRVSFLCPLTNCQYNRKGFPRRDNCIRHIKTHQRSEKLEPIVVDEVPSTQSSSLPFA